MISDADQVHGVGILGAGRVSRDHVYAVKNIPGLRLIGIADPDEARSAAFGQRHQCLAYTRHQELLEREDVDLILAGVPHWLHATLCIEALNAGKHVMIEKPMAMTLEECDAMTEAAAQNEVQLMVGHTQHFFSANIAAKRLIQDGAIGDIILATQTWYKPFGLSHRSSWMLDRTKGGGLWLMNGAHMVDCLLWLIDSQVVAVKGSVTHKIMGQKGDDSAIALIEFANGVCATVMHSGAKRPDPPPPEQWLTGEFIGTEGSIKTTPYEARAWLNTDGEYQPVNLNTDTEREQAIADFVNHLAGVPSPTPVAQSVIQEITGVMKEIQAFVTAIESGGALPVSHAYARSVIKTLLAVEESSRIGREVRL